MYSTYTLQMIAHRRKKIGKIGHRSNSLLQNLSGLCWLAVVEAFCLHWLRPPVPLHCTMDVAAPHLLPHQLQRKTAFSNFLNDRIVYSGAEFDLVPWSTSQPGPCFQKRETATRALSFTNFLVGLWTSYAVRSVLAVYSTAAINSFNCELAKNYSALLQATLWSQAI